MYHLSTPHTLTRTSHFLKFDVFLISVLLSSGVGEGEGLRGEEGAGDVVVSLKGVVVTLFILFSNTCLPFLVDHVARNENGIRNRKREGMRLAKLVWDLKTTKQFSGPHPVPDSSYFTVDFLTLECARRHRCSVEMVVFF